MLAVAYEKTQELARDLRAVGCGDLDVEGNELTLDFVGDFCECSSYSLSQLQCDILSYKWKVTFRLCLIYMA